MATRFSVFSRPAVCMAFLGQQDLVSACVSFSPSRVILVKASETRGGLLVYTRLPSGTEARRDRGAPNVNCMRRTYTTIRISSMVTIFFALAMIPGCGRSSRKPAESPASSGAKTADVDDTRITNADREPGNWMSYGRSYSEQRFSPLKDINDQNAARLGLAWHFDLDTRRGQEATPLVVDGRMYFTSAWSKVFALDAATGSLLWSYDPRVPPEWGVNACCDVVNRGVAAWRGKIFFGTLDGRLIALDAATGNKVWET